VPVPVPVAPVPAAPVVVSVPAVVPAAPVPVPAVVAVEPPAVVQAPGSQEMNVLAAYIRRLRAIYTGAPNADPVANISPLLSSIRARLEELLLDLNAGTAERHLPLAVELLPQVREALLEWLEWPGSERAERALVVWEEVWRLGGYATADMPAPSPVARWDGKFPVPGGDNSEHFEKLESAKDEWISNTPRAAEELTQALTNLRVFENLRKEFFARHKDARKTLRKDATWVDIIHWFKANCDLAALQAVPTLSDAFDDDLWLVQKIREFEEKNRDFGTTIDKNLRIYIERIISADQKPQLPFSHYTFFERVFSFLHIRP